MKTLGFMAKGDSLTLEKKGFSAACAPRNVSKGEIEAVASAQMPQERTPSIARAKKAVDSGSTTQDAWRFGFTGNFWLSRSSGSWCRSRGLGEEALILAASSIQRMTVQPKIKPKVGPQPAPRVARWLLGGGGHTVQPIPTRRTQKRPMSSVLGIQGQEVRVSAPPMAQPKGWFHRLRVGCVGGS